MFRCCSINPPDECYCAPGEGTYYPIQRHNRPWSPRFLGQARILYARRQYPQALKLFQDVLRYNPECKPDPRIGIGLCFWALDQRPRAKAAWQRSLEVVRGIAFRHLEVRSPSDSL